MDVLVSGSTGLIGAALVRALEARGDRVRRLRRGGASDPDDVAWDIDAGTIGRAALAEVDAVVHLAGEGIGERRWTDDQKRAIRESRTRGTSLLARALADAERKPAVFVSASAIGYYGDRGDEILTEASAPGDDFLARVCVDWEQAAQPAADAGVRTVWARTGIVLDAHGGALARMALPFKLGVGGRIGSGRQFMSWVTLDDEVRAILHAIDDASVRGPINVTAPNPVSNQEFTATLGRVLRRPTVLPTPLFGLRALYGAELVEHLLLFSQRVQPTALTASGFAFAHPQLEPALRAVLGRER
ncbi:MAG TPA: TIGR01777 family oxidoreductase [Acidimicrobiia bacterium]|nr:TIGR01777 family oxidoreductase [Acidimicrobiia bacterium]